jgi:peptidyl-prolyl cis-trans isomerase C
VNGEKITFEEVDEGLATFQATDRYDQLAEQGDVEALSRQFEQGYLATLVRRQVLGPEAEELGIEVTDAEVTEQIDVIKADFPSEEAFQEALKEQALAEPQLKELVYDRLLEQELRAEVTKEATPSDEEVQAFYDENAAEFEEVTVQHILVEDKQLASVIQSEVESASAKEVDKVIARLAKKHSTDTGSAKNGGQLPPSSASQYVEPFADAVGKLQPGEIAPEPVKTEFGFHVVRLVDRQVVPFEEARTQISTQLAGPAQDEAWQAWVKEAYEEADVSVNPRYGELDPETGQIVDADAEDVPAGEAPADEPEGEAPPVEEAPQP